MEAGAVHKVVYQRDQLGRPTQLRQTSTTGTLLASWAYDTLAKGQLTSSTRHQGTAAYVSAVTGYDDAYRPLGESVTIPATEGALAGTYTTTYTYTLDGQIASVGHPTAGGLNGETVAYGYDALSLPRTMTGGPGWGVYVADSDYDSYGRLVQQDLGAYFASFRTYFYQDGTNRLQRATLLRENAPGMDLDVAYTYDQAGNPTSIIDRSYGQAVDAQCFTYDGLRRLSRAFTPANANCATAPTRTGLGGPAPYWVQYTYDNAGNRVQEVDYSASRTRTRTYTHAAPGAARPHAVTKVEAVAVPVAGGTPTTAASTFAYDAAGNTITRTIAGQNPQALTWDTEGRLAQVTKAGAASSSYVYGADGQRLVRREGTTTTVYLPGGTELSATGTTLGVTRFYAFAGQAVATRTGKYLSQSHIIVSDAQSTAQVMVRGSDNTVARQRTSVFGETRTAPVSWPTNHGFLDKPVDGTGLVAVGARYYDPGRARFISVDPVMDLSDPRQWNPYAYASNNPVTFMDPTGMFWAEIGTWINDNQAAIVGGITAVVVTSGCLVATGGTGSVLCAAAGGAAAGAASNLWATQVQEVAEFSWTSLATDTAIGGATGALTGAIPGVGQAIARSAVGQSVASSSVGTATRAAATTVTRAASRVPGLNRLTAARACSFAGATPVLMANGQLKAIEDVVVGDLVIATDPETGQSGPRAVEEVFVHDDTLIDLVAGGEVLATTEDHPFWSITDHRFIRADALKAGDHLLSAHGDPITITALDTHPSEPVAAYNLAINDIHTYHVGSTGVLVHNRCGLYDEYGRTLANNTPAILRNPENLRGLAVSQVDDLARNAGYQVTPGRVNASNPAIRYYAPDTNFSEGFRVLLRGVSGQPGVKAGTYASFFGQLKGNRVPLVAQ